MVEPQEFRAKETSTDPEATPRRRGALDLRPGRSLSGLGDSESAAASARFHSLVATVSGRSIHRAGWSPAPIVARRLRTYRAGGLPRTLRTSRTVSGQPSSARSHETERHHAGRSGNGRGKRRAARLSRAMGSSRALPAPTPVPRLGRKRSLRRDCSSNSPRFRGGPRPGRRTLPDDQRAVRPTLVG